jgi:hypothetical protein
MSTNTDLVIAAALDEQIYRRAEADFQISDSDFEASGLPAVTAKTRLSVDGLTEDRNSEYYYNDTQDLLDELLKRMTRYLLY